MKKRGIGIAALMAMLVVAAPAAAHRRVVFGGDVAGWFRPRPMSIHVTSDQNIENIKWSSWGRKRAHGTGTMVFSASDGLPPAPLALTLSRRHHCGKRRQYLKLRVSFVSGAPPGSSSSYPIHYTCRSPS